MFLKNPLCKGPYWHCDPRSLQMLQTLDLEIGTIEQEFVATFQFLVMQQCW